MLQQPEFIPSKRFNSLNEFTMRSRLMTEEETRLGKKSEWCRVNLEGHVKNFPRTLCSMTYITTLVIKENHLERLPPELGNLVNLVNLDASHNRLQSLPPTLGDLIEMRALILNDNKICELPLEIGRLLNLRHLNLNANPLTMDVMALYGDGSEPNVRRMVQNYMYYYYLSNINSTPPQRQWRRLDNPSKDGFPFTIMCYNVLSPNYATANMYPYCPSWAMDWDYRRRSILEELRLYKAHIICLQEIDSNQFEDIFKPELAKSHYDGIFLPKSRRRTMDDAASRKVDGCAIFWQTDKFKKLAEYHHEFMLSCSNVSEHPAPLLLNRVMTRDNVALSVIFETVGPSGPGETGGRQFCVTTGHVHWDPEHSDVKLIQTIMWTAELWAHLESFLTNGVSSSNASSFKAVSAHGGVRSPSGNTVIGSASQIPVILCGDFNSLPNSGVVEFLTKGCVPKSHTEFLNFGFKYQFEDWKMLEKWAIDGDILRHRFNFDRAYREGQGMRITNLTYDFKGMIDYIYYTTQHLRLLGSLDQVPEAWFVEEKIVGCPHVHVPSDHFPLLVELDLVAPHSNSLAVRDKMQRFTSPLGSPSLSRPLGKSAGGDSAAGVAQPDEVGASGRRNSSTHTEGATATTDRKSPTTGGASGRHRKR